MYLYRAVSSEDKLAVGGALLRQAVGEVDVGSLCVGALPPQPVGEAEGHCVKTRFASLNTNSTVAGLR